MLPLRGQSGPGSKGNEGVLCIPQSSRITRTSPSDFLCHIPDTCWGGVTPLQRSSRCILQHQPTGKFKYWYTWNTTKVFLIEPNILQYVTHFSCLSAPFFDIITLDEYLFFSRSGDWRQLIDLGLGFIYLSIHLFIKFTYEWVIRKRKNGILEGAFFRHKKALSSPELENSWSGLNKRMLLLLLLHNTF